MSRLSTRQHFVTTTIKQNLSFPFSEKVRGGEKELILKDTTRKFGNSEFSTKPTNYYNLDVIISVGYRVKSQQGTQFRIWTTQKSKTKNIFRILTM